MKISKLILAGLAAAAMVAVAPRADAQKVGLYQLLSGTTTINTLATNQFIVGGVTNQLGNPAAYTPTGSNLVQTVGEYDYVGLTWKSSNPVGSTNGLVNLKVYKSFDNGATYEALPSFTYSYTPTAILGAGSFSTNVYLDVHGVSHLAFSLDNNTVGYITNVLLEVNCKANKVWVKPALQ